MASFEDSSHVFAQEPARWHEPRTEEEVANMGIPIHQVGLLGDMARTLRAEDGGDTLKLIELGRKIADENAKARKKSVASAAAAAALAVSQARK